MTETAQSSESTRVRWLWGKLSAVVLFAALYFSARPALHESVVHEAVVAAGLLLGTVGVGTYLWRFHRG